MGKSFDQEDTKYRIVPFLTLRWYVLKVGIGDAGVLNNLSTDLFTSMGYIFSVLLQKLVQQCWDFFLEHWVKVEVCI